MKIAVIVFPGSSHDLANAIQDTIGEAAEIVWHTADDLSSYDAIMIAGGASYGNYLRAGAIASLAPVMDEVKKAADAGKYVLGVGNGFQILAETGLLPGAFLRNSGLKFRCHLVDLTVENNQTPFTCDYAQGEQIRIPIAHDEGNYYVDNQTQARLKENRQIVFRYAGENPNGSADNIAGVCNERGNVVGMMPLPERAISELAGSKDGARIFTSVLKAWREQNGAAIGG